MIQRGGWWLLKGIQLWCVGHDQQELHTKLKLCSEVILINQIFLVKEQVSSFSFPEELMIKMKCDF